MKHVKMATQLITMAAAQTEHQLLKAGCDQEGIKQHQIHAHFETTLLAGTKMILIIQLNVSLYEVMVKEQVGKFVMMIMHCQTMDVIQTDHKLKIHGCVLEGL